MTDCPLFVGMNMSKGGTPLPVSTNEDDRRINERSSSGLAKAFFRGTLFLLLFMMVLFPAMFAAQKFLLLIVTLAFGALSQTRYKFVDRSIIVWMLVFLFSNACTTLLSYANGNDATFYLPVALFEPIALFALLLLIDEETYAFLLKALIVISYSLIAYDLLFVAALNGLISIDWYEAMPGMNKNIGGILPGFVKFTAENVTWMEFLAPLFIATALTTLSKKARIHSIILSALLLLCSFLCFRTAFFLCIGIGFVFTFIFSKASNMSLNIRATHVLIGAVALLVLIVLLGGDRLLLIQNIVTDTIGAFSVGTTTNEMGVVDMGGKVRAEQATDLIYTWLQRPLFGWGTPSNSLNVVRSATLGAYELSYIAMLMQRGAIGTILYAAQILWFYIYGRQMAIHEDLYSSQMLCLMVAYTAALFVNFTNPYFGNFDRLIIQFLPLLLINLSMCRTKKESENMTEMDCLRC